jgi:hypothetical protein
MEYITEELKLLLPLLGFIALPFVLAQFEDRLPSPKNMATIAFLIILAAIIVGFQPIGTVVIVAVYYHILCQAKASKSARPKR